MDRKDKKRERKSSFLCIITQDEKRKIAHEEKKRIATQAKELLKEGPSGIVKVLDEWIYEEKEAYRVRSWAKEQIKKGSVKLPEKDRETLRKSRYRSYFYEFIQFPLHFRLRQIYEQLKRLILQMRLKNKSAAAKMIESEYVRLMQWAEKERTINHTSTSFDRFVEWTSDNGLRKFSDKPLGLDPLKELIDDGSSFVFHDSPIDFVCLALFKKQLKNFRDRIQESIQEIEPPTETSEQEDRKARNGKELTRAQKKLHREADIAIILKEKRHICIEELASQFGVHKSTISRSGVWRAHRRELGYYPKK